LVTLLKDLPDSQAEGVLHASSFVVGLLILFVDCRHLLLGWTITPEGLLLLLAYAALELFLMLLAVEKSNLRK
jgi:uncharacterized membrane protein